MTENNADVPERPKSPFGFPDFGTPAWKDAVAQIRLSGDLPRPASVVQQDVRAFIAQRRAEIAAAEKAKAEQEIYDQQHRRLRREAAPPAELPAPEPKRTAGRTVAAENAGQRHARAIGAHRGTGPEMSAQEELAQLLPPVEPAVEQRETPSPGRVSRRGVIGG